MFEVEYYSKPNGEKPVKTFIDGLEPKMRAKAAFSIDYLRNLDIPYESHTPNRSMTEYSSSASNLQMISPGYSIFSVSKIKSFSQMDL